MADAEFVNKLKIQSKAAVRMAKELAAYAKESRQSEDKLQAMREKQADKYELKKQQEFVQENAAVLQDTNARARQYLANVERLLEECEDEQVDTDSEEYKNATDAAALLRDACEGRYPTPTTKNKAPVAATEQKAPMVVAVYGSSRCAAGDELYAEAEELGKLLGQMGCHVMTGGYHGTMEAVSKGAKAAGSPIVEGVISPNIFTHRGNAGNPFLTKTTPKDCLQDRIVEFTKVADVFVVLPGNAGTLAEFFFTWNVSVVQQFCHKPQLPLFAWADPWEKAIGAIQPILGISDKDVAAVTFVKGVPDLKERLLKLLAERRSAGGNSAGTSAATPAP